MSKIIKENSINMIRNQTKVPMNENLVKRVSSNNSNKQNILSREREFGRDITNITNEKQKSQNETTSTLRTKYNDMKKVCRF